MQEQLLNVFLNESQHDQFSGPLNYYDFNLRFDPVNFYFHQAIPRFFKAKA
jgi:hypothetical protein